MGQKNAKIFVEKGKINLLFVKLARNCLTTL
jgi:hypothetical protein